MKLHTYLFSIGHNRRAANNIVEYGIKLEEYKITSICVNSLMFVGRYIQIKLLQVHVCGAYDNKDAYFVNICDKENTKTIFF